MGAGAAQRGSGWAGNLFPTTLPILCFGWNLVLDQIHPPENMPTRESRCKPSMFSSIPGPEILETNRLLRVCNLPIVNVTLKLYLAIVVAKRSVVLQILSSLPRAMGGFLMLYGTI